MTNLKTYGTAVDNMKDFTYYFTQGKPSTRMIANRVFEKYGIIHLGINTFTEREWGSGGEDPALFNPVDFDAPQIVNAAKDGGLQGIILVCKHHDGFCLWPTQTTSYNISQSPWRSGRGDIVKEISDACRTIGIKFGVYVSPWDRNNAFYGNPEYVKVFHEQIREVLSNYGPIFEMWFDGANGGSGYYGGTNEVRNINSYVYYEWETTWSIVRQLQPDAMIFSDVGPDRRWGGTECGYLHPECRCMITPRSRNPLIPPCPGNVDSIGLNRGMLDGRYLMQPECDFPLRKNWFYKREDDGDIRSPEKLLDIYLNSVGCGGTMNIGLAPDQSGKLHPEDVRVLKQFNKELKSMFSNCKFKGRLSVNENRASIDFGGEISFNLLQLSEDYAGGEKIAAYQIEVRKDGRWHEVFSGKSVGIKRIRRLEGTIADALRLTIMDSSEQVDYVAVEIYDAQNLPASVQNTDNRIQKTPGYRKLFPEFINRFTAQFSFEKPMKIKIFCFEPNPDGISGTPDQYKLESSIDGEIWEEMVRDEFSNIRANPVLQTVRLPSVPIMKYLRFTALSMFFDDTQKIDFKEFGVVFEA